MDVLEGISAAEEGRPPSIRGGLIHLAGWLIPKAVFLH